MKKILIAFDSKHFSEGAFEFARRLNLLHPILLTGVFLPQSELANLWSYADAGTGMYFPVAETPDPALRLKQISHFEHLCLGSNIDYRVHEDLDDLALPSLEQESRFADLMIIGSEMFYNDDNAELPENYLKDLVSNASCPVLIVPEKIDFPESIILAYDGSEESLFAIKQFAYLFPELCGLKTLLVHATQSGLIDFPYKIQMEELVARHFKDLTLFKLTLDPKKYFSTWLSDKQGSMLVCGSYGRSGLSMLFRKSFVKDVIASHRLPIFIAHK